MGTGISPSVQQIRLEFMWKEEENMGIRTDYSNIHFKENGKLKLLIIVGTRPEIIRLAAVINKCRRYFDVVLASKTPAYPDLSHGSRKPV